MHDTIRQTFSNSSWVENAEEKNYKRPKLGKEDKQKGRAEIKEREKGKGMEGRTNNLKREGEREFRLRERYCSYGSAQYWPLVRSSDLSSTPLLGPNFPSMGQISSNTKSLVGLEETAGSVWGLMDPKWLIGNNSKAYIALHIPLPQT